MRKMGKRIIAALMALLLPLTAACSLVSVNEDRDNAQVVAKVNGVEITKGEFKSNFYYMYDMYVQLYSQFGMQEPDVETLKADTIDGLVSAEVMRQKGIELGFSNLTAEEQAQADADFEELWQSNVDYYITQAEADAASSGTTLTEEQLTAKAEELLLADMTASGMTKEEMKQGTIDQLVYSKLLEAVEAEVTVTDADIQAAYDLMLSEQKTKYAETPAAYETDAASATVAFIPPGYIRVKHILIKPDDTDEAYMEYTAKLETLQTEITDLGAQVGTLYSDSAGSEANQAEITALDAQITTKRAEETALKDEFFASLKPKADEALAKAKAGEDFDALVETYGNDPGMTVSPAKEEGYLLYADGPIEESGYDPEFTRASIALANVGDVSELVPTSFGYHIIKLVEKVATGDVPLDNIKEAIREQELTKKQSEHWTARQDEWVAAATVETFPDIVSDVGVA